MTAQEFDVIDIISKKDEVVCLSIMEGRNWKEYQPIHSLMFAGLIMKVYNYIQFVASKSFQAEYGASKCVIVYFAKDEPPGEVIHFLRSNNVQIASLENPKANFASLAIKRLLKSSLRKIVNLNALQKENALLLREKIKGLKLDFSLGSLNSVDNWLAKERNKILASEKHDLVILCGAYLGEVIRKEIGEFGGVDWSLVSHPGLQPICLNANNATLNPLGKVMKFIESGKSESLFQLAESAKALRKEGKL